MMPLCWIAVCSKCCPHRGVVQPAVFKITMGHSNTDAVDTKAWWVVEIHV
jgi:hypothetical protein